LVAAFNASKPSEESAASGTSTNFPSNITEPTLPGLLASTILGSTKTRVYFPGGVGQPPKISPRPVGTTASALATKVWTGSADRSGSTVGATAGAGEGALAECCAN